MRVPSPDWLIYVVVLVNLILPVLSLLLGWYRQRLEPSSSLP